LADLVARFHECGYVHRDLYLSHIFYAASCESLRAESVPASLRLIDLQRLSKPTGYAKRLIVKDLAALNFSAPSKVISNQDRIRWIKRYLGIRRLDAPARRLIYWIVGKTWQIARHDARRTARLAARSIQP